MGTRAALSYTDIFMGQFEEAFITSGNPYTSKIKLYRRYIDDLFFLQHGSEVEAQEFVDLLNANTQGISFTLNFHTREI